MGETMTTTELTVIAKHLRKLCPVGFADVDHWVASLDGRIDIGQLKQFCRQWVDSGNKDWPLSVRIARSEKIQSQTEQRVTESVTERLAAFIRLRDGLSLDAKSVADQLGADRLAELAEQQQSPQFAEIIAEYVWPLPAVAEAATFREQARQRSGSIGTTQKKPPELKVVKPIEAPERRSPFQPGTAVVTNGMIKVIN